MNDLGNKYALAALRERRAHIGGEIVTLERRLRYLRDALTNLDGTLQLFDPNADPSTIPAKRPYVRSKLFGAGKLNRMILDAMRKGGGLMSASEIVDLVCAELNYGPDAVQGMQSRVRSNLVYLHKVRGLVVKEGERETARWGLRE